MINLNHGAPPLHLSALLPAQLTKSLPDRWSLPSVAHSPHQKANFPESSRIRKRSSLAKTYPVFGLFSRSQNRTNADNLRWTTKKLNLNDVFANKLDTHCLISCTQRKPFPNHWIWQKILGDKMGDAAPKQSWSQFQTPTTNSLRTWSNPLQESPNVSKIMRTAIEPSLLR